MRLRLLLSLAALLAAAGNADAGVRDFFKKPGSLPTPISLTDARVERSAGATKPLPEKHPPQKYSGPDWGSRFDQIKNNYPPRPLTPRLRRLEY